jgi:hypothetical protein
MRIRIVSINTAMKSYIAKKLVQIANATDIPTFFCFQEARDTYESILRRCSKFFQPHKNNVR